MWLATRAEIVIPAKCISQTQPFGRTVGGAIQFDQTQAIADRLPANFTPFMYNICINNESRQLQSFSWTYSNEDRSKYHSMSRVGPKGGTCFDFKLEDDERGHFDKARTYRDDNKIAQLVLISTPV